MPEPILTLTDVVVAFGALRAVDGVSLSVSRGERRAIIGPNGAGKTTLFNAIAGMVPPTSGRIGSMVTTSPAAAASPRAARHLAHLPDHQPVSDACSVQDNMVLALRGLSPRKFSLFGEARYGLPSKRCASPLRSAQPALRNVPTSRSRNCPMANNASSRSRSRL